MTALDGCLTFFEATQPFPIGVLYGNTQLNTMNRAALLVASDQTWMGND